MQVEHLAVNQTYTHRKVGPFSMKPKETLTTRQFPLMMYRINKTNGKFSWLYHQLSHHTSRIYICIILGISHLQQIFSNKNFENLSSIPQNFRFET